MTEQLSKPLFIPLKTEYYEAFKNGTKTEELRKLGPRWNEKTCGVGRDVILSKGYGKQNRMKGIIWKVEIKNGSMFGTTHKTGIEAVYGTLDIWIICISIRDIKPLNPK